MKCGGGHFALQCFYYKPVRTKKRAHHRRKSACSPAPMRGSCGISSAAASTSATSQSTAIAQQMGRQQVRNADGGRLDTGTQPADSGPPLAAPEFPGPRPWPPPPPSPIGGGPLGPARPPLPLPGCQQFVPGCRCPGLFWGRLPSGPNARAKAAFTTGESPAAAADKGSAPARPGRRPRRRPGGPSVLGDPCQRATRLGPLPWKRPRLGKRRPQPGKGQSQ